MSLVDPKNPARWKDGTTRRLDTAFTLGYGEQAIDWSPLHKAAALRRSSARTVEAARKAGSDRSTIHGLSKKADSALAHRRYSPSIEGAEAGRTSANKRDALKRGGI